MTLPAAAPASTSARLRRRSLRPGVWWLALLLAALPASGSEPLTVTFRAPESSNDQRLDYETELLRLALEKTRGDFGPYQLQPGAAMNLPRAISMARQREVENLFFKTSYSTELNRDFAHPPYPVDRGVMGYRICFVHSDRAEAVSRASSLEELRQFTIGQGRGWLDVDILRHNGFTVVESDNYANLFPMLAAGRIDLFCRGMTEVEPEWRTHRHLQGLSLDQSFALYYPLPRFFWTHRDNRDALERITRGLERALADGSAEALWQRHHGRYLDFVQLGKRRLFTLENPSLEGIEDDYARHFHHLLPR